MEYILLESQLSDLSSLVYGRKIKVYECDNEVYYFISNLFLVVNTSWI